MADDHAQHDHAQHTPVKADTDTSPNNNNNANDDDLADLAGDQYGAEDPDGDSEDDKFFDFDDEIRAIDDDDEEEFFDVIEGDDDDDDADLKAADAALLDATDVGAFARLLRPFRWSDTPGAAQDAVFAGGADADNDGVVETAVSRGSTTAVGARMRSIGSQALSMLLWWRRGDDAALTDSSDSLPDASAADAALPDASVASAVLPDATAAGKPKGLGRFRRQQVDGQTQDDILVPNAADDSATSSSSGVAGTRMSRLKSPALNQLPRRRRCLNDIIEMTKALFRKCFARAAPNNNNDAAAAAVPDNDDDVVQRDDLELRRDAVPLAVPDLGDAPLPPPPKSALFADDDDPLVGSDLSSGRSVAAFAAVGAVLALVLGVIVFVFYRRQRYPRSHHVSSERLRRHCINLPSPPSPASLQNDDF